MTIGRVCALVLCLAVPACGDQDDAPPPAAAPVTRDAQLVFTLDAGADAARALAEQASTRAAHPETRSYAATLAADHRAIADILARTAQRAGIQPAESGVAAALTEEARTASSGMGSLTGVAYDLAFVEGEVRLQQALLSALERDAAALENAAVQQIAADTRPTIAAHVQRGRQILTVLREAQVAEQARITAATQTAAEAAGRRASETAGADQGRTPAQPASGQAPAPSPTPTTEEPVPTPTPRPLGVPVRMPPDTNAVRWDVR